MTKLVNNRQVNVWRGSSEPPTIHHLWIKDESTVLIYDEEESRWVPLNEFPGISFQPDPDTGTVIILSGKSSFRLAVSGPSLGINTDVEETITITSDALNSINTEFPLKWDLQGKKLTHEPSKFIDEETTFGPSTDISNSSSFIVPEITVDMWGHVLKASSHTINIPGKVTLNVLNPNTTGIFPIVLAPTPADTSRTEETYKTEILLIKATQGVNAIDYTLVAPNIEINGNLEITGNITVHGLITGSFVGNVTGTATPTNHADVNDTFGLGTSAGNGGVEALYGHVKLLDTFSKDTSGAIIAPQVTAGVAASPLLVYNAMQEIAKLEDNLGNANKLKTPFTFSNDFSESNEKIYINWLEI